jgi:hypothetical protein
MHMRHYLRQLVRIILGGATPRAGTGMLTCSVTLASALWVSVSMPNLPLVRGLDDRTGTSVAISLQSALLGIDDRSGAASNAQALARVLGLSANVAKLLTPAGLSEGAYTTARSAFAPVIAQLDPFVSVEAAPAVHPPSAPSVASDVPASPVSLPVATYQTDTPVAAEPVVVPPHPKSDATPAPATPSPQSQPAPQTQPSPQAPGAGAPAHDDVPTAAPDTHPSSPAHESTTSAAHDVTPPAIQAHVDLVAEATGAPAPGA